jgi:hypothetical protein
VKALRLGLAAIVCGLAISVLAYAQESSFVYVVKPGKTPIRGDAKMEAAPKGQVSYGQRLSKVEANGPWLHVKVPGDALEGWIPANAVLDKRPGGLDHTPVGGSADKLVASEGSTAGAIRGLDGRTAAYAKDRQIPQGVFDQVARIESHGEALFNDHHTVDAKGAWHYPDLTVAGRVAAAQSFASAQGLRASK